MTETNHMPIAERLFEPERPDVPRNGRAPSSPRGLSLEVATPGVARLYIAAWHSRLPDTQRGPWKLAMTADCGEDVYAAALWHNPSARGLPQDWLELRRLACAPDAPRYTASWMLGKMAKWIHARYPECERLISYQDTEVHTGTIYRAAGWTAAHISKPRERDRSGVRAGTLRSYRRDLNGQAPSTAAKVRWELPL